MYSEFSTEIKTQPDEKTTKTIISTIQANAKKYAL